ncbi:MarR family winged helix-turn-helix transcriptional regulator [uncultured Dialister sp.]|jgi:DNA-binding MarR family transcriptional regulator|uniref:MarR family winged helix-turn-helix transcriptional regulator n=1 Tax=uncultured Dialister sp. TaxID=278064 RepID=UPI0025E2CE94|nr:MarR family transcriptional regulator [uncultured Dialister sp.]
MMEMKFSTLYNLVNSMNSVYQKIQKASGLPSSEYWVMFSVYKDGSRFAHEICLSTFMSRQTASLAIKNLVRKGWLTVEVSPENRRTKELHTTEEGMIFAKQFIFPVGQLEEKAWSQLSPEEKESSITIMSRFRSFFIEEAEPLLKEVTP